MILYVAIIACFGLGPLAWSARSRKIGYLPFALTAAAYSAYALAGIYIYVTGGEPPFVPSRAWQGLFLDDDLNRRASQLVVVFLAGLYAGFFGLFAVRLSPPAGETGFLVPKIDAVSYRTLWLLGLGLMVVSFGLLPNGAFSGVYSVADGAFPLLFFGAYLLMAASTLLFAAGGFTRPMAFVTIAITLPLLFLGIRQPFIYFAMALVLVALRKRRLDYRWVGALVIGAIVLGFVGLFREEKDLAAVDWISLPLAPFQYAIYEGAFTYYNLLATLTLVELRPGGVIVGQGFWDIILQLIPSFVFPNKYAYMALWNLQEDSPIPLRPFGTFFGLAQVYLQGRAPAVAVFGLVNGAVLRWIGKELATTRRATTLGLIAFTIPMLAFYMVRGTIAGGVVMIVRLVAVPALLLVVVKAILRVKPDFATRGRIGLPHGRRSNPRGRESPG